MFESPKRHDIGPSFLREATRGPFDKDLQRRSEWMVEQSEVLRYLFDRVNAKEGVGPTVLCAGAGKGHEMEEIGKKIAFAKVIGLDPHDFWAPPVKSRVSKEAWDTDYLPESVRLEHLKGIPDASVDAMTLYFVLHHMEPSRYDQVMGEIRRVLKDDGLLFVAEDLADSEEEHALVAKIDKQVNVEILGDDPHNYKNLEGWKKFFSAQGFSVEHVNEVKPDKVRHAFMVLRKEKKIS